ncbi:MAG: NAD(P)/FAD-dependent oxidoreductase, partial [Actinomycetota bacterium]
MNGQILVIGGGCMGVATAHHLLSCDPSLDVTVLERDPSLARSSTLLSDGNVRIQFNLEENIAISLYALEVLETFADDMAVGDHRPEVAMKKQGNLFLVDEEGEEAARAGLAQQLQMGARVEWMGPDEIADRYPPLRSDRFIGGTFGPDDGSVDPTGVVQGLRRSAAARGAVMEAADVVGIDVEGGQVRGVRLADGARRGADAVVVCAGAWSTDLLATAGVEIPVVPVMRTVYVVSTDVGKGVE